MGSQSRIFQHRRPDSRAIPGCLPLRAEGATAPATNRRHQAGSGPSRWASSRHTQATTSSRSGRASPAKRRYGQDSKLELAPLAVTERAPGRNRSRIPSKATGSARLAAHQPAHRRPGQGRPRPGTCCCEDARAPARAQSRRCRPPASPAGRIRRALTPSPGCGPHPGRHIQTAGHDS
jgi:hypothetical protein